MTPSTLTIIALMSNLFTIFLGTLGWRARKWFIFPFGIGVCSMAAIYNIITLFK